MEAREEQGRNAGDDRYKRLRPAAKSRDGEQGRVEVYKGRLRRTAYAKLKSPP